MNCIDLFSGAGGLTEGFIRVGYNILAHVEKEYPASLTLKTRLAYHYLKENNKLDIYIKYLQNKINREEFYNYIPNNILESVINEEISDFTRDGIFSSIDKIINNNKIDIIIGGPPCQAYSLVGRARSKDGMASDERNYLYKQYLKFLDKYQPNIFVFENVKGILSAQGGKLFPQIKSEMEELGYNVQYQLLNSKDFGVPQSRQRVIIIGTKENVSFQYPDFEIINNEVSINDLFQDLPRLRAGEKIDFSYIKKRKNKSELNKVNLLSDDWDILTQHIARPHNERDLEIYKIAIERKLKGEALKYTDLPERLRSHNNLKSFLDRFKVVGGNGICHTMVAHISKDGHHYIHPDPKQNRSLTVREAARIQSFPDDYYFENSRTSAFKQIGNAVPPLMAEIIATKIKNSL